MAQLRLKLSPNLLMRQMSCPREPALRPASRRRLSSAVLGDGRHAGDGVAVRGPVLRGTGIDGVASSSTV
eukprot:1278015-Pyramimonas_sp.AAC.1